MKIALFYYLPASGAKRVVYEHAKGLTKKGHTIDVYTYQNIDPLFNPSDFAKHTYSYDYHKRTIHLPILRKISSDFSDFKHLKSLHQKIAADIDSRSYDIALVHTDAHTQAPFLLQFLKTKNVYFCLEPLRIANEYSYQLEQQNLPLPNRVYESINRYIRKGIDRTNARSAHHSIAISYFGRELMIQAFDMYPDVSYIGVDTSVFKKKNLKKKNQILFVGQKLAVNGYDYALKAMELLPSKNRPSFYIHSWTKNKKERVTDEDLSRTYNESLLTLSLSTFDTFGLVPLESLACGTPVIAFNVAGYRETMQQGKTGYLVEFDSTEIANKIKELTAHPELAKKIGDYGATWVGQNWTWEQHIVHMETLLTNYQKK